MDGGDRYDTIACNLSARGLRGNLSAILLLRPLFLFQVDYTTIADMVASSVQVRFAF